MKNLNSKKFIFSLVVVVMSGGLLITKYFTAEQFKEVVELVFGVYVAGNVVTKFSK